MLPVCDAHRGHELEHLARAFRAATDEPAPTAAARCRPTNTGIRSPRRRWPLRRRCEAPLEPDTAPAAHTRLGRPPARLGRPRTILRP
ncbi:MAG: hypothetical protein MZW92_65645 [Comamonadaceae bacterium]|nr:hypothetical protein [Comamonadaceae bacterium]